MSENGEIYTADKNFTLPPALTAWTNSTSVHPTPSLPIRLLHSAYLTPVSMLASSNAMGLADKRNKPTLPIALNWASSRLVVKS